MPLQVTVVPESAYEIPEGQRRKPDGRRALNRKNYPPRAELREQFEKDFAEAAAAMAQ